MIDISYLVIVIVLLGLVSAKLVYVVDVGNSGARYPVNDLYDGKQVESMWGQITGVGMRQQYLLGSYLRADYIDKEQLVPSQYDPNSIEVFASSSIERSLYSALCRMYGFYPPGTGWTIPSSIPDDKKLPPYYTNFTSHFQEKQDDFALDLGFQPVPITNLQSVLNDPCPNSGILKTQRLQALAKTLTQFQAQHSIFIAKMKLVFNLTALQVTVPTMAELYDTVYADLNLGRELPHDFDEDDLKTLRFLSSYYNTLVYSDDLGGLLCALPLNYIQQTLEDAINKKVTKKWSSFMIKQQTFMSLATRLNLTSSACLNQQWNNQTVTSENCRQTPTFSSNLMMEVHEDETFVAYLKVKYNGEYVKLCGNNSTSCQFHEFWRLVSTRGIDYNTKCYSK